MTQLYSKSMFSFVRNQQIVFQPGHTVFFVFCFFSFSQKNESLCCFTSSPAFSAISFLDFCHSNWCVVVFHCCLIIIALMTSDVELLFICLLHLCIFFGEVSLNILGASFKLGCLFSYC